MESKSLTLFELNNQLKASLKKVFPDSYWIIAEISEININHSGHCYLELIEKNTENEQIIARAKATIWAFTFRMLQPYFESVTKQKLTVGIKIMVQVSIEFHEVYGYSLNIKDIEPTFTVGDLSRIRAEIIERLTKEGVFHLNKELEIPLVPQRIAIISSDSAAGYGDFMDQLTNNKYGYTFNLKLYQAYMQGNEAEQSIIQALENIFQSAEQFDCVVIIRGGGSQADFHCFNSYWLCYHITQFPLPIITGIGHERDETIADLVAHSSLKTPTAVAEFLLDHITSFNMYLIDLQNHFFTLTKEQLYSSHIKLDRLSRNIVSMIKIRMNSEKQRISSLAVLSKRTFKSTIYTNQILINNMISKMITGLTHFINRSVESIENKKKKIGFLTLNIIKEENNKQSRFENSVKLLDPSLVLKRGYSMTFHNGILIKSVSQIKPGDVIDNKWLDGIALSTVNSINKYDNNF